MHSTETETHTQREREGEEVYCFGKVSHFCCSSSSSSSMMPRSIPSPHLSHIVARKQEDGSGRVSKHRGPSVRRIRERERMIETSLSVTKASHRRNDSRLDRRINVPSLRCASWGAGASQTLDLSPAAVRMRSMLYVHRVHAACISFFFFYCFLNAASPCMSPINSSSEPMVLSPPWIHDASPKIASSLVTRKRSDGFGELCVWFHY